MKYLIVQAFWYLEQTTGEFHHRIGRPGEMVERHPDFMVHNIHVFHPLFAQLALSADLLILHLVAEQEVGQIIKLRAKMGKPTIYEIPDNFLQLGKWVPVGDALRNPLVRQTILAAARACDALQLSSPALREVFGEVNKRVQVFENQIDHFSAPRPKPDFVFGWGGSLGHAADLADMAPAIERFCRDFPEARFAYMGDRELFDRLFAYLPNAHHTPPGSMKAYYHFLRQLSVGIAPLVDNPFNRCRSDGKFLEYAAHGAVPLLADVTCYRHHGVDGENCLFFKDGDQLYQQLATLARDSDLVSRLAANAFNYVKVKRSLLDHVDRRISFYRGFLKFEAAQNALPEVPACAGLIARLHKAGFLFERNELTETLTVLDEALAMVANYDQAHMLRLRTLVKFGDHRRALEEYQNFECSPVYWDLLFEGLAQAALALGDARHATWVRQIADPVKRTMAAYKPSLNNERKYRKVLKMNPYHYESLINLGLLLAHRPKTMEEALALFHRAAFLNPEELRVSHPEAFADLA